MSYYDDFRNDEGWSAVDVSARLNTQTGRKFLQFLRDNGVDTIIRYYASTARPKTITPEEALTLTREGFGILPVFQDHGREIGNFSARSGEQNATSAMAFAKRIGQPRDEESTILFAVDADFSSREIDGPIVDYFTAINETIGTAYSIGAYGGGAVLAKLLNQGLIKVPWLGMSRGFLGTEQFFYSNRWAMRQIPPEKTHAGSGIGYDRNVVREAGADLGAFQVDEAGTGVRAWAPSLDATVSSSRFMTEAAAVTEGGAPKLVTTEGLRLRRTPGGPIIRELTIGDAVIDHGEAGVPGWRDITAGADSGVAHSNYLREPGRPEVEMLLRVTVDEWLRFDKGRADEKADPYYKYVREMWAAIGEPYDGRSRYANGRDVPWSAAFISWVVRQAGPAYAKFKFNASHSVFVNDAIGARMTNRQDKPFWGYRINEQKPELGDIIQRNRGSGAFSFSYAENHANYESHSDVVVEITPDVVRVMGGNVDDTVTYGTDLQEYDLNGDGFIKPGQRVIAILKNRAGL